MSPRTEPNRIALAANQTIAAISSMVAAEATRPSWPRGRLLWLLGIDCIFRDDRHVAFASSSDPAGKVFRFLSTAPGFARLVRGGRDFLVVDRSTPSTKKENQ